MKLKLLFLYLILTAAQSLTLLSANNVYFHRLSNKDGLPQLSIYSIYQDETGAMWFGTVEGLCRYNGKETRIFTSKRNDPFTQNAIHTIFGNGEGALYLKAEGDLLKYDIINEKFECLKRNGVSEITYTEGIVWFANNYDIYQYKEEDGMMYKYTSFEANLGRVSALTVTDDGRLWIGRQRGLTIAVSSNPQEHRDILKNVHARSVYVDSKEQVWVSTNDNGLYQLNLKGEVIHHYVYIPDQNSLSNNQVRTVLEDDSGKIWVGTYFGLNCFDPETETWTNHIKDDSQPNSLSHSSVFALYKDTQGTLWIGTYFGGVNYFNPQSDIFRYYNANSYGSNNLSFPFVGNMVEDKYGTLWICTEGGGLNSLDLTTKKLSRYLYEGYDPGSVLQYNLKCIWYDSEKDLLYLGIHNGGMGVFNIRTKQFRILKETIRSSLARNSVRGVQYYNGQLFFINAQGLNRLDLSTEKVLPVSDDKELTRLINSNFIYHFYIDSRDRLWLSTPALQCFDLKTNKRTQYKYDENNPRTIGKFKVTSICETQKGDLFFGTTGSGVFKYNPDTDDFDNYTEDNKKIISDFCYHITETNDGNLILLHNNGVAIFDPLKTNSVIYKSPNNFPITSFFEGNTSYITRNNEIFIGGTNGLVSVFESQLTELKPLKYELYFDNLYVNNKRVTPHDNTAILTEALPFCDRIRLKHNQNNISIQFASSNYSQDAMQSYEYRLDDFDKSWNPVTSNMIIYTNLNPGSYSLTVREIQQGAAQTKHKTLRIVVDPPFYKTTFAYLIYIILFIAAFIGIIRFFVWRSELAAALEIERNEKEQNEKLNQFKLRFFTNISHELRTPLTLIIAQLEYILQSKKLDANLRKKMSKIFSNATHIRNLISELLDFRKQEQGYYKLRAQRTDIIRYVKDVYDSFEEYARKHRINFKFEYPEEEVYAYIDRAQFGKAIYNILSNAFKYTSDNGEITVRVIPAAENVIIQVEDNGIGIPADKLAEIFVRFYQVEYRTSGFSLGTGIGLALSKEIVESHHGVITVNSTVDKGSLFEISFPLGRSHFTDDEIVEDLLSKPSGVIQDRPHKSEDWDADNQNEETAKTIDDADMEAQENDSSPYSILIVEDNEELLELLKNVFSEKYKVYTATDGKEGFEKTLELQPNIVLSDVMMPVMSGKEMCYKIKNNINLAHIPVVLLTAQDSTDQTIEGYMFGADDYITKPFNIDLLIIRCNSIVKNRQLLYRNVAKPDNSVIMFDIQAEVDKEFIDKATKIIKENFANLDFDMDMLASELCLGRNKLYTKMKSITNLTPNEFTLNLKLQESTNLLENYLHLNVSEIALQLGFTSTKYFSRCFKSFYGVTPVQWRKTKLEGGNTA